MIKLRELLQSEFRDFMNCMVDFYAEQSVRAGRIPKKGSLEWSENETKKFLSRGFDTPNNFFYVIESENSESLGYIWCGQSPEHPDRVHLFSVNIFGEYRNQGIGTVSLELLEKKLQEKGYNQIGLHVYSFNNGAIHVYRKLGYQETDLIMTKKLQSKNPRT